MNALLELDLKVGALLEWSVVSGVIRTILMRGVMSHSGRITVHYLCVRRLLGDTRIGGNY